MHCIVIGGTGELGSAVCAAIARAGGEVAFTWATNDARADALAARLDLEGSRRARVDATDTSQLSDAIDGLARALGGLDAIVHCAVRASTFDPPRFDDDVRTIDPAGFDRLFAINVRSAFFAAARASTHFGPAGGNIVFLGSIDGLKAVPSPVAYAGSKGALVGMARSMAKELGPRGIRVNVVAPGILEAGASRVIPESVRAEYLKHTCAHRFGALDEVAELVAWFAVSNTYVTGQAIAVDGGL